MKIIRKILPVIMTVVLALGINMSGFSTMAADANVTIALSSATVSIGQNVTATVTVSGSAVSQYSIYLTYNSSVLSYVSGSGAAQVNGGGGTVMLVGGTGSTQITFSAIANGSSYVSTSGSEVYNINYEQLTIDHAGANITVATAGTTESGDTTENADDDTTDTTTEDGDDRSSNCNLQSLKVSPGTLEPAFSASTTSYSVQLDETAAELVVSATTEDDKASTAVSGNTGLKKGENIVNVTVTAENGAVKVYKIRAIVGEVIEDASVTIDGKLYTFVNDATELEAPELFSATTVSYQEWEVMAWQSPNGKVVIVYLTDEDYNCSWFVYDEKDESFYPYCEYSAGYNRYIIIPVPAGINIPYGYTETEIEIQKNKVTAYKSDSNEVYLIYAMNIDGSEGFYYYDTVEGTYMRYIEQDNMAAEVATVSDATPTDVVTQSNEGSWLSENLIPAIVIAVMCVLILINGVIIVLLVGRKKNVVEELERAEDMIEHLTKDGADRMVKDTDNTDVTELHPENTEKTSGDNEEDARRKEKKKAYVEFEKQSAMINDMLKQDYDVSLDSAFSDESKDETDEESIAADILQDVETKSPDEMYEIKADDDDTKA